jgi:hypothetical protein
MRRVAAFASAVMLMGLGVVPGHADKRVALVIGNGAYRNAPALLNPKNDAEDVGRSLQGLGFETIVAADLDRGGMNDALDRFSRVVADADVAVVYYSGHGMQFAGKNYLLPVDAKLAAADDVNRFRLVPLDDIMDILQTARGARRARDRARRLSQQSSGGRPQAPPGIDARRQSGRLPEPRPRTRRRGQRPHRRLWWAGRADGQGLRGTGPVGHGFPSPPSRERKYCDNR